MAAEVQETTNLSKVDSAISDVPASPDETKAKTGTHRRSSSNVSGVFNINDLGVWHSMLVVCLCTADASMTEKEGVELKIAPETQRLNW